VIAGARRFDGRVQRQQIGLVGDTADRGGDLADVLGTTLEFAHELDRGVLAGAVALDGAHGSADLHRGFGEHHLNRFGPAPRGLGLGARLAKAGDDLLYGAQLLLRGARGLAGAACDLLHSSAQFLCRGGGLGEAAGQLLGGGGEAL
jgi:hypothetical protein